jgi:RNA polymerase primary sigma factor
VNRVLNKLDKRERNILLSRYQLNGGERHSLRRIGDRMGISTETVRQTEFRALRKLRRHAEELRYYIEAM